MGGIGVADHRPNVDTDALSWAVSPVRVGIGPVLLHELGKVTGPTKSLLNGLRIETQAVRCDLGPIQETTGNIAHEEVGVVCGPQTYLISNHQFGI